jgi:glutamate synthase (NADPH/NADH) small chain
MPGSQKEYKNACEEGVDFTFYAAPKRVITNEKGEVVGIEMIKTALGQKDESGRARMEEQKGSEFKVDADVIVMSLGFDPLNPSYLAANGIETNAWGGITLNDNFETSTSGVFAGGDCYRGADLVVRAAYDGREAARAIIKSLK